MTGLWIKTSVGLHDLTEEELALLPTSLLLPPARFLTRFYVGVAIYLH
jgi:hypothetical protein